MYNSNMKKDDGEHYDGDGDEDEDKKFTPGIKTCICYINM